ncbi:ABC transporter permease [Cohaesibacter marisflavi]|nr:ABC transporter permease subunit [Cohaesibacter marisflavi]
MDSKIQDHKASQIHQRMDSYGPSYFPPTTNRKCKPPSAYLRTGHRRMIRHLFAFVGSLWSGWTTLSVICLVFAFWQIGFETFGPLVLPEPLETIKTVGTLISESHGLNYILITSERALLGFLTASCVGIILGLMAGWSNTLSVLSRPLVTMMQGMPPIAWIVIALLWFGGEGTPIFTVFVTTLPLIFAGTMQGVRMRDGNLDEMADSFRISRAEKFIHVQAPQIVSYLFPAWATSFAMSWKVVMTAELLASGDGVGAGLAEARVNIDTVATMAWIVAVVGLLLLFEGFVLNPVKSHVEGWKNDV